MKKHLFTNVATKILLVTVLLVVLVSMTSCGFIKEHIDLPFDIPWFDFDNGDHNQDIGGNQNNPNTPGGEDNPGGDNNPDGEDSCKEHEFDEGVITKESTCYEQGTIVYTCEKCSFEKEELLPLVPTAYIISIEGIGELRIAADGKYSLNDPVKVGYKFIKWIDASGTDFAAEGIISESVTVSPVFELLMTSTVEELAERAEGGADKIVLVNDIVIDRTIYVTGTTNLTAVGDVKIIRDSGFTGDMFVVGQTSDGKNSILMNRMPKLTLGDPDDESSTLTIDGNRDGMNEAAEVAGTAIYMLNSARVDMYDGVILSNHNKVNNKRIYDSDYSPVGKSTTIGGAAVMIGRGSAFYMYGGIMDNNSARVESVVLEDGTTDNLSGYGGAVFNAGTFRMYGGAITNCSANRGGAIYSNAIIEIVAGLLENNYAKNKGGAICSSGSDGCDIFIGSKDAEVGTVTFKSNSAGTQGGAILSYADSPLLLFGGILFEGNAALGSNGGAISTSGPITSYKNEFVGNTAKYSGGAIYQTFVNPDGIVHIVELWNNLFERNSSNRGGAITLTSTADVEVGAYGKFVNCKFVNNSALSYESTKTDSETGEITTVLNGGNGGAIYSSQRSIIDIDGCEFTENLSENLGGGAIGATVSSKININGCLFKKNSSIDINGDENGKSGVGGAIYAYNGTELHIFDTSFIENSSGKNGGALYLSDNSVSLTNVEFIGNYTMLNGGAIAHYSENVLNIKGIYAVGNSAGDNGGVIYNSKSTLNILSDADTDNVFGALGETEEDSARFANSANNGGVICGGNASIINIVNASFVNNIAIATEVEKADDETGEITITYENGRGGAFYLSYDSIVTADNIVFTSNRAKNGGAIYATEEAYMNFKALKFEDNSANAAGTDNDARGGAIYMIDATLEIDGADFIGNHADYYGGAIDAHTGAKATLREICFINNSSVNNGGALWSYTNTEFDITGIYASGNTSQSSGGFAYTRGIIKIHHDAGVENIFEGIPEGSEIVKNASSGGIFYCGASSEVIVENTTFVNSKASNGGAIYVAGIFTGNNCSFTNNNATNGGAVYIETKASLIGSSFVSNHATFRGGAIYVAYDENSKDVLKATVENSEFKLNDATEGGTNEERRGGGIYIAEYCIVDVKETVFAENSATQYGGAISVARGSKLNVIASEFSKNKSYINGGAIWLYSGSDCELSNSKFVENSTDKEGGALYSYSTINVSETEFSANTANSGGAIFVNGTVNTRNCSFTFNKAASGGAVYVANGFYYDGVSGVADSGSSFISNTASYRGGAIYVLNEESTLTKDKLILNYSLFKMNLATEGGSDEKRRGGAIAIAEYVIATINNATFEENAATQYGGAISVARGTVLNVNDTVFNRNTATNNGGAIWLYSESELLLFGGEFNENNVLGNGGALYSYNYVNISKTVFVSNSAENGGALYITGGNTAINECSFDSNSANYGGAVYVSEKTIFTDGIDINDGENTIEKSGSLFSNNSAKHGGAIYLAPVEDPTTYPDRLAAQADIEGGKFIGNTATASGAAIYAAEGVKLSTAVSIFDNNTAKTDGIVFVNKSSFVYVDNASKFVNNVSETGEGGAIHSKSSVELNNTLFENNKVLASGKRGGAIYLTSGSLECNSVVFNNNYAAGNGGAIVLTSANKAYFDDCTFENNNSDARGGAIYITSTTDVKTLRCEFNSNSALTRGGAVYVTTTGGYEDGDVSAVDSNSVFTGNKSIAGGALFVDNTTTLNGTKFVNNIAKSEDSSTESTGGAIASEYGTVTINNATFSGNIADKAGAIYDGKKAKILINSVYIADNSSGIVVSAGSISVSGNVIVKNNKDYNILLPEGKLINVFGVLETTSEIGFSAVSDAAVFAKPDGVNVTEVSAYINNFFSDNEDPLYIDENGYLSFGFIILEQPSLTNDFTVITSVQPTSYEWYTWVDGVRGDVVIGENTATLVNGVGNQTYVCVITLGEKSLETEPVLFKEAVITENHPICGTVCGCGDESHSALEWYPIANLEELVVAAATEGNYYLTDDICIDAKITITANVNICLSGHKVSRGGTEAFRMIEIASGITLVLTDCASDERVGYIDSATGLWIEGTYSGDETVTEYNLFGGLITNGEGAGGTAVYVGGTLYTYGINFAGNKASTVASAIYGSGIFNDIGSVFVANIADGQAGAVQISGVVNLKNTKFISNKSTANRAGALLITVGGINANGVLFKNNVAADGHGGAVVITGANEASLFVNCIFEGNSALGGNRAGAIYAHNSETITTLSCVFKGNTSKYGGAIYNTSSADYIDGSAEGNADASIFKENASTGAGGAIYSAGTVELYGTLFEANDAKTFGGAIYFSGNLFKINGCSFKSNTAVNAGAIYTKGTTFSVINSNFTDNVSSENGGAIFMSGMTLTTENCIFTGNTAKGNGGAVYVLTGNYIDGNAIVTDETVTGGSNGSTFTSNAAVNGGAICIEITSSTEVAGKITLYAASFISNSASDSGGAIINTASNADIYYCIFDSNVANSQGGAVISTSFDYVVDGTTHRIISTLTMIGGEVKNNKVDSTWTSSGSYAGGVGVFSGSVAIINSVTFDNNKAYSGGAITSYGSAKVVGTDGATVTVYTTVSLDGVVLKNNDGQNGAVYVGGAGRLTANNLVATDNTSKGSGAVFYLTSANSVLTINSAIISGNKYKATHDDPTSGTLGFVLTANSANTLNIYKAGVTGSDVNDNWDVLIVKGAKSTVNELTSPTMAQ